MNVTLSWDEVRYAGAIGFERALTSARDGRQERLAGNRSAYRNRTWTEHIEGACAELAFAKARGLYWDASVNRFRGDGGDVGDIQVRSVANVQRRLLVRMGDPDDAVFVLVVGVTPSYTIAGWLWGREAKQDEFLTDAGNYGQQAYFVPADRLRSLTPTSAAAA